MKIELRPIGRVDAQLGERAAEERSKGREEEHRRWGPYTSGVGGFAKKYEQLERYIARSLFLKADSMEVCDRGSGSVLASRATPSEYGMPAVGGAAGLCWYDVW